MFDCNRLIKSIEIAKLPFIKIVVALSFGIKVEDLTYGKKYKRLILPRQTYYYLACLNTRCTHREIEPLGKGFREVPKGRDIVLYYSEKNRAFNQKLTFMNWRVKKSFINKFRENIMKYYSLRVALVEEIENSNDVEDVLNILKKTIEDIRLTMIYEQLD